MRPCGLIISHCAANIESSYSAIRSLDHCSWNGGYPILEILFSHLFPWYFIFILDEEKKLQCLRFSFFLSGASHRNWTPGCRRKMWAEPMHTHRRRCYKAANLLVSLVTGQEGKKGWEFGWEPISFPCSSFIVSGWWWPQLSGYLRAVRIWAQQGFWPVHSSYCGQVPEASASAPFLPSEGRTRGHVITWRRERKGRQFTGPGESNLNSTSSLFPGAKLGAVAVRVGLREQCVFASLRTPGVPAWLCIAGSSMLGYREMSKNLHVPLPREPAPSLQLLHDDRRDGGIGGAACMPGAHGCCFI